jgi:CO dehydrogenase maturation factor
VPGSYSPRPDASPRTPRSERPCSLRLAVVGKGGSGKSVIAGTLARLLARQGERVLAVDSDLVPGLALSLGVAEPAEPPLRAAAERDEDGRWRLRKGIGPVRAVGRYAIEAPDGVLLLQAGKVPAEGVAHILDSVTAFYQVVHRLSKARAFADWTIIADLPAGPRQVAFDWVPYAEMFLLVVEPSVKGALTARRIARIARARGAAVLPVANKVAGRVELGRMERMLGEPLGAHVPCDPAVAEAERIGAPLIEHAPEAPAVRAVESIAARLTGTLGEVTTA